MPIKFSSELRFRPNLNLDLTEEMKEGAEIIASEIRGNIKRGSDPSELKSHPLNEPKYAQRKLDKLGHQKPLVAFQRKLIDTGSYVIKVIKRNSVVLRLSNANHPKSKASIAQIGAWNHNGTENIPARPFFAVSEIASKRVTSKVADKISRLIRGKI
jgi:phage gpG-like protein